MNPTPEMASSRILYIASKMRGEPDDGFLAFQRAEMEAAALGWTVKNPHAIDMISPQPPASVDTRAKLSAFYMARDLPIIAQCDAVYMFGPWRDGTCTWIEELFAVLHAIPVMYESPRDGQRPLLPPELCMEAV